MRHIPAAHPQHVTSANSDTKEGPPTFCLCLQIENLAEHQNTVSGLQRALQWRNLMQTESQLINSEISATCLPKCPYGKGISNPLAKKGSSAPCEFPHLFSYSTSGSIKQIKRQARRREGACRPCARVCVLACFRIIILMMAVDEQVSFYPTFFSLTS